MPTGGNGFIFRLVCRNGGFGVCVWTWAVCFTKVDPCKFLFLHLVVVTNQRGIFFLSSVQGEGVDRGPQPSGGGGSTRHPHEREGWPQTALWANCKHFVYLSMENFVAWEEKPECTCFLWPINISTQLFFWPATHLFLGGGSVSPVVYLSWSSLSLSGDGGAGHGRPQSCFPGLNVGPKKNHFLSSPHLEKIYTSHRIQ